MVNAQKWIEREYPASKGLLKLKSSRNKVKKIQVSWNDLEGSLSLKEFTSLEELYIQNDLLKSNSNSRKGNAITSLDLTDNEKLVILNCSNNQLTNLDLSKCFNLKELYCYSNQLTSTEFFAKLPSPKKLTHLNISDNNFPAQDLSFLSKFTNLENLYVGNNEFHGSLKSLEGFNNLQELGISNTDIDSGLEYLPKKKLREIQCETNRKSEARCQAIRETLKEYYEFNQMTYNYKDWVIDKILKDNEKLKFRISSLEDELSVAKAGTDDIKNILLIGRTGSGKSTLANTLTTTNKFEARDSMEGVTKSIQKEIFEDESREVKYRVIDTVGINDNTGFTNEEIMQEIADVAYNMKNGITQVLFVTKDRFDKNEINIYNLLRGTVFDEEITNYTTIVRTNSHSFMDEEWREEEREQIMKSGGELSKIIGSCNEIIYVDNPPTGMKDKDERNINLKKVKKSRDILLTHLATFQQVYQPKSLRELNGKNSKLMKEKKELKRRSLNVQEEIGDIKEKMIKGEMKNDEGQKLLDSKTKEHQEITVQLNLTNNNIANNTMEHMQEKAEEKGLGQLWLEVLGKSFDKAIEIVANKCEVM